MVEHVLTRRGDKIEQSSPLDIGSIIHSICYLITLVHVRLQSNPSDSSFEKDNTLATAQWSKGCFYDLLTVALKEVMSFHLREEYIDATHRISKVKKCNLSLILTRVENITIVDISVYIAKVMEFL